MAPMFDFEAPAEAEAAVHYRRGGVRYKLIHKLGHGAYATVWLASLVDGRGKALRQFRALKFQKATVPNKGQERLVLSYLSRPSKHPGQKYVLRLIDHFSIRTVNGVHEVIVTPVLGPSLHEIAEFCWDESTASAGLPPSVMKRLARELLLALDHLKNSGVVHAAPLNRSRHLPWEYFCTIPDLDGKSEDEVMQLYGPPYAGIVKCYNESKLGAMGHSVPKVVYEAGSLLDTVLDDGHIIADFSLQLIDFGQAFIFDGVPSPRYEYHAFQQTRAPEVMVDQEPDWRNPFPMDVWSVGCSLVQLATGSHLFLAGPEQSMLMDIEAAVGGALPSFWPSGLRFARSNEELGEPSLEEVLNRTPYGNEPGFCALLRAMLVLDPTKLGGKDKGKAQGASSEVIEFLHLQVMGHLKEHSHPRKRVQFAS
ncbi:MAG: hypothetical protein M1826_000352 [Phylliscum demangeonii]|nr:MAG: hypothetical protein M1826_000352 [Phylliscum demangeonii]